MIKMKNQLEVLVERPESSQQPTPLLFVHGMWHGAWCWQEHFLPYFAQHGYESYALSLQGHGKSTSQKPLRSISLADYVSDLSYVVNEMPTPPVLIGHSMGGMIVQKYLETHQAPAAVLLAPVPTVGLLPTTIRFALRRPGAFIKINLKQSLFPVIGTPKHCKEFLFSDNMPDDLVEKYYSLMQDESYRAYLDMVILNLARPKRVKTPLLVLGAENDAAISIRENERTAKAYGTQAEIFPNMAHDMMLEADWQKVADRILEWLREIESTPRLSRQSMPS
jgi:pimeloyl-ACP methyl ester carboxylesterase